MSGAIIRAVSPLVPLVAGLIALAGGVLVLRTYGPRYRVGRLPGRDGTGHAGGPVDRAGVVRRARDRRRHAGAGRSWDASAHGGARAAARAHDPGADRSDARPGRGGPDAPPRRRAVPGGRV